MPTVTARRSGVYHVLLIGDVYVEVKIKFSELECLILYFLNTPPLSRAYERGLVIKFQ